MKKDIRYVPTPPAVVEGMLDLAELQPDDLLFDLGCGDGRLPIGAARRGARAVGIDIDHRLVTRSQLAADEAGVSDRVEFRVQNFFDVDLSEATVVTIYLLAAVNMRLLPKLLSEMRPGTRLISHHFDMENWEPEKMIEVETKFLFRWRFPGPPLDQIIRPC